MTHCWADKLEWITDTYGDLSPEYCEHQVNGANATCLLPDGHDGSHVWTPDDDIVVTFTEAKGGAK